jgi:VCBS repeat protein
VSASGWLLALPLASGLAPQAEQETPRPREVRFEARREWALEGKPEGLCAADLDGDGRAELLAATIAPGALVLWRGSPGGLGRDARSTACGDWPLQPVALPSGAFGAGSKSRRVAVASRATRSLELFELDEGGLRRVGATIALPSVPRALAAGDLGADGVREIAVACDDRALILLRESGAESTQRFSLADELPRCARILADGSGLVVGFQSSGSLQVYRCESGEAPPALTLELEGFPRAIEEVDLDGDGDLELAVAGGDRSLWVWGLSRAGGPRAWMDPAGRAPLRLETDAIPVALASGAFGATPRPGIALLHAYDLSVGVWSGWSDKGPALRRGSYAGQTPVAMAAGDFDADGHLDLALANRDALGISFLSGDGADGLLAARSVKVGRFPNSIAAGEMCGDARAELFVLNSKDDSLTLIRHGAGGFEVCFPLSVGREPRSVACGDLDGDGRNDAALLVSEGAQSRLVTLFGDGTGGLSRRDTTDRAVGPAGTDLLLSDLDGDRLPEVLVADPQSGAVWLLRNRSSAERGFALAEPVACAVPSAPVALAAIQLDHDAPFEIAVALGSPGARVGVALLDGVAGADGALALREIGFLPVAGAPIDLAVGDGSGDGRSDLLVLARIARGSVEGFVQPWIRAGGGESTFEPLEPLVAGHNAHHIVAGDVNGDRRWDFFVAAQNSHTVNGWLAGGTAQAPSFQRLDDLGAGRGCLDLALADLDGDGRLDLAVVNAFSEDVSVILTR